MKATAAQLKAGARRSLEGNYGIFIASIIIYGLISTAANTLPDLFLPSIDYLSLIKSDPLTIIKSLSPTSLAISQLMSVILSLLLAVLLAGLQTLALKIARDDKPQLDDLFFALRNHPDRFILLELAKTLISYVFQIPTFIVIFFLFTHTLLLTEPIFLLLAIGLGLLMMIPTVIALYGFSLSEMLLLDHKDLGTKEALRLSYQLMKGHKFRYFRMQLSFIPWWLLVLLTFGIASFWLTPYIRTTEAKFYLDRLSQDSL